MKDYKCESGYIGRVDEMRDAAKRMLKGDIDAKTDGSRPSASAQEFMKRRPYKKGGHVKKYKDEREENEEMEGPHIDVFVQRHKKGGSTYKKGGKVKMGTELDIPSRAKVKKPKLGNRQDKGDAFMPMHPKKVGKPMIGMKKKSPKLAHGKPMKINKRVKAKSQPYDASMGQYLKAGGKTKRGK